ncbi:hypothetical protein [Spiroplasma platyhelix]|uniref:Uncharacterized protein n=1 Tax=Spiroplasma platyhelix PALS-1 TaxID=1276218 RepID=A0A846U2R1_9MOLU|nr:hypothetical protein [Spiroplasma platyhelix]MBE4704441.1 hypothetical protein [Spiroplasma platyhelix PALS-1]NKE38809.1 hypothetical protein [Spiroplasma platyhelix PALS-1]UJB29023.1 hypothetical protein SPLAT_v1c02590 [Spiroplasma platyhelix PALS-1]
MIHEGPPYSESHSFYFANNKGINKEFGISSGSLTFEVPALFNSFDFTNGVQLILNSEERDYTKIFQKETGQWVAISKEDYSIDYFGNIN